MWRTGSVGESGPFIGLGYGYTIELAKRITTRGRARAFELKTEMLAELPIEPDVLSFTDQEIVDGMAYYSWSIARTLQWLRETIKERLGSLGLTAPMDAALVQRLRAL